MRRCSFASTCRYRSADDVPLGLGSAYVWTCRNITSRGQFNPIHNFSYAMERGVRARDVKAFEKLITNPGPLRVAYTPDYLDWLHRCYKAKGTYMDARAVAEKKFNGNIVSSELSAAVNRREGKRGDTRGDTVDNDHHNLPGAPPPGMFLRPAHSFRRLAGELKRRRAQSILDEVARAQGMLDLFERQPHFPAIHIDRCSRFHLVELFKEMVLERSLDSNMIWEKALLYRAILSERKPSYPTSFHYIFTAVEDTVFAPTISTPMEMAGSGGEGHDRSNHPLAAKCPTLEAYYYYVYLVKKYYIDNAVEAHVVLRCHREPNAADLLFSNPPPKDDTEIMKAVELLRNADIQRGVAAAAAVSDPTLPPGGEGSVIGNSDNKKNSEKPSEGSRGRPARPPVLPGAYPPIDMLWRCEENLPLLKVLLFGEFNLIVSENPFVKFPSAHGFLTRPYSTDSSRTLADGMSLANVMAEKRGHLLPSLPRNTATSIDARAQDIRRLQQKHHRDDIVSFQKLLRSTHAEDSPSAFSSYSDWSYFNPRAVRAEERDRLTRKAVEALKLYDSATNDIYRHSFEDVQACHTQRVTERDRTMPPYLPTLPHFVAIIKKDPHISFLLHIGLPDRNSSEEGSAKHKELEKRIYYLARALYHTALEYHNETVRRVNRQKVNVAASLLDNFVEQEWTTILRDKHDVTDVTKTLDDTQNDKKQLARRLGRYMLFANRTLDDTGFPTDARADDYTRWMAPPSVGKIMSDRDVCIQRLTGANQDHILTALEHGSEAERASLTAQITNELAGVDFRHFNDVLRESLEISKNCSTASLAEPPAKDSFFDISSVDRRRGQAKRIKNLEAVGYKAIQKGQIAFLILAGGSGTRLGFDKPKGFFTCDGLQQRKSLFMMHCEKIRRRQEIAESISGSGRKARVQLLVMTSGQNDAETQRFFEENSYFGLEREQVHFFAQSSVPCYDENTGRIIMENRGRICAAPGGNGAVFAALAAPRATKDKDGTLQVKESLLQHLRKLGIAYVQIGNIDNLLANVADPVFIGYAIEEEAHVVVKTCPKRGPDERVGVFVRASGKWGVVEYTEIGDRAKEIDDATGELKFNCANISSNLCSLHFMSLAAERMKSFTQYHAARKKIPTIKGPVMGIKLEAFLFDLFRFVDECDHPPKDSGAFRIMQVDRDDEFGPVKNADGAASDTPADAVRLLLSQHTRWLITALETAAMSDEQESIRGGVDVTEAKEAVAVMRSCSIKAEISPLVSVSGEGLRQHLPRVIHQLLRNPPPVIFIRRDDEVVSESSNM